MADFDKQQLGVREAQDSIQSGDNNGGLGIRLDIYGRSIVNLYYSVSADATITLQGQNPRGAGVWRDLATFDTTDSNTPLEDTAREPYIAYEEVRAQTKDTGIDVELELTATR